MTPPSLKRTTTALLPLLALLAPFSGLALVSAPARAQTPPGDEPVADRSPGQTSIPAGPGGAILKREAAPPDAPAPGKPTMPRPLNYAPPDYPPEAKAQGIEGTVTLQIDISKEGKVTAATVVDPAGHGFDEAAVAAGRKLEFSPARKADGAPFAARILYRYSFTLQKAPAPENTTPGSGSPAANVTQSLHGKVLTSEGDVPLAGAVVTLIGAGGLQKTLSATAAGEFAFDGLPPGAVRVEVSAPGYEPISVEETVSEGELTDVKYRLSPTGGPIEILVRGERPPREVTKRTLEQREISRVPGTNGDALKALFSLPGVARPTLGLGLLIVRGSSAADSVYFVDGTPVALVYHFGGLSAAFPTEMLDKLDFYPGNFSAQYGRAQGGVVEIALRSPKDDGKYHGLAQADFIDARALLEGPVPLFKKWRFIAAGRRSYLDALLGPVLRGAGAGLTQLPVYYDYQLFTETNPTSDSTFRVGFFGSDDSLALTAQPSPGEPAITGTGGFHTTFMRLQARYTQDLPGGDKLRATMALGRDSIDIGVGPIFFNLAARSLTGRLEYAHKFTKGAVLNTGIDIYAGNFTVDARLPAPSRPGQPQNQPFSTRPFIHQTTDGSIYQPALYAELELVPAARARIVPGVRLDYFIANRAFDLSPRVNARYDVTQGFPRTTVKGGVGVFQQPPAFQETVPPFGNPKLGANRAIHYSLGVERELTKHIEASVEGFYKQLDNLVYNAPSLSGSAFGYANGARGYAVGSELYLKYKPDDRFFGWLAYTLSRSVRDDGPGTAEHLASFDQTHILTVLGSYRLGHGWEIGARFQLTSGNLITPNVCNPADPACDPNRIGGLFHAPSGVYTGIPFGASSSERLPLFHKLDVRLDKRWKFPTWQLSAYLDVQNAYDNGNVEGVQYNYNYTSRLFVTGIPILPSIGMRGEF
jgi:TonB family protein